MNNVRPNTSRRDNPVNPIVIIDDDHNALRLMDMNLRAHGYTNVMLFNDSREARRWTAEHDFDMVLLDIIMPNDSGMSVLEHLKEVQPEAPVVMATGVNELNTAIRCMKKGAHDYLVKPLESERFLSCVANAVKLRRLQNEYFRLSEKMLSETLRRPDAFSTIVTADARMKAIFRYVEAVAPTHYAILITGETGTGKEVIARAVHECSGAEGDFTAVNIAGLDDNAFSDTLFGHVKGAYTGAGAARAGLVESAGGGTLLLDEIGDLPRQSQVKLLRLLQEKEYFPLGSDRPKKSSCRIIAATNKNLEQLGAGECLRKDLFYRLKTHHIALPPLRERKDDIELLLNHFLRTTAAEQNKRTPSCPPELLSLLSNYSFPGNVRELQAMVNDALSTHTGGVLSMKSFSRAVRPDSAPSQTQAGAAEHTRISFHQSLPTLREARDALVGEAMKRAGGNQSIAARMLGITRQSLAYRLKNRRSKPE